MDQLIRGGIVSVLFLLASPVFAQTNADLMREIRAMHTRIADLEAKVASYEAREQETSRKLAALSSSPAARSASAPIESDQDLLAGFEGDTGATQLPPGIDDGGDPYLDHYVDQAPQGWWNKTSFGGYGELHANFGDKEEVDFHRFVLFFDHQFNEKVKLVTELELEHSLAGEGKPGELELEQAYIDFNHGNGLSTKAGLFLLPIGLLNERHEPPTFFGTERNMVEKELIPTTWWEGGAMVTKKFDSGLQIDVAGHSGLDVPAAGGNAYRIRSGRQKVAEAPGSNWAATGRILYKGIPGLEVGVSGQYQDDITQTTSREDNTALLGEAHVDYSLGGFGFRALYGAWSIDGATPAAMGVDQQSAWYLEPSYTFPTPVGDLGFFGRFSKLDTQNIQSDVYDVGMNFWPDPNVVLKFDYTHVEAKQEDTINVGVGYQF